MAPLLAPLPALPPAFQVALKGLRGVVVACNTCRTRQLWRHLGAEASKLHAFSVALREQQSATGSNNLVRHLLADGTMPNGALQLLYRLLLGDGSTAAAGSKHLVMRSNAELSALYHLFASLSMTLWKLATPVLEEASGQRLAAEQAIAAIASTQPCRIFAAIMQLPSHSPGRAGAPPPPSTRLIALVNKAAAGAVNLIAMALASSIFYSTIGTELEASRLVPVLCRALEGMLGTGESSFVEIRDNLAEGAGRLHDLA